MPYKTKKEKILAETRRHHLIVPITHPLRYSVPLNKKDSVESPSNPNLATILSKSNQTAGIYSHPYLKKDLVKIFLFTVFALCGQLILRKFIQ